MGRRGNLLKCHGTVTGDDLIQANKIIYETEERTLNQKYQLVDFMEVERFDVSSEDVLEISKQDRAAAEINHNLIVTLAGRQDLVYGLIRMWEIHVSVSPIETMAFKTLEAAKLWIEERLGIKLSC